MRLIDADELIKYIPPEEYNSRFAVMNAPTIETDWTELMVICDNCGHAIHVKRMERIERRT